MELNKDNYFSLDAKKQYLSVSTIKEIQSCEAKYYGVTFEGFQEPKKDVFIQGHYLHAWAEGKLDEFRLNNPELYSTRGETKGQLKSEYRGIERIIQQLESDKGFMFAITGEHEKFYKGELFGVPFKIQADVVNVKHGFFTDLKFMQSLRDKIYDKKKGMYVNFVEAYNYILQIAIYREIIKQNENIELEGYIAAVDKQGMKDEKFSDKELISFDSEELNTAIIELEQDIDRIIAVWRNEIEKDELHRCGTCEYCKATKKIEKPVNWKYI